MTVLHRDVTKKHTGQKRNSTLIAVVGGIAAGGLAILVIRSGAKPEINTDHIQMTSQLIQRDLYMETIGSWRCRAISTPECH